MNQRIIDLAKYSQGVSVLAGRDRGYAVRKAEALDSLERDYKPGDEPVLVRIPETVLSVNSSFFLGMFEKSIRDLGADGFRSAYRFEGNGAEQTVADGIRAALLMGTRLRPLRRTA